MSTNSKQYPCRKISSGISEGEALLSSEEILFYFTNPENGCVTEPGHCLEGKSVAGKILIFPGGKGSSVVQADGLYRLEQNEMQPAGFIVMNPDTVLVSCAVVMEVPMVSQAPEDFYRTVRDGMRIRIDAAKETIELFI